MKADALIFDQLQNGTSEPVKTVANLCVYVTFLKLLVKLCNQTRQTQNFMIKPNVLFSPDPMMHFFL